GRAFTFVFEDPDWLKKVGIAALVSLIPVVGSIAVLGWTLEITRRVIKGEAETLPEWNDFGAYIGKGFQALVVGLGYAAPLILILLCGLSISIIPAMLSGNGQNSDAAGGLMGLVIFCTYCLVAILGIGIGIILPAAYGKLADTGELGAAFRFGEVIGLVRAAPGPFLMVLLGGIVANGFIAPLGSVACGIGVLFTAAYAMLVMGHLYGQAYKTASETRGSVEVFNTL
ncbi:DUF4013 domain-containing protein, partial [bacterium]|nr:DUF4013 domain-containing protein [bacterium]